MKSSNVVSMVPAPYVGFALSLYLRIAGEATSRSMMILPTRRNFSRCRSSTSGEDDSP
jgi:hypothetical protein